MFLILCGFAIASLILSLRPVSWIDDTEINATPKPLTLMVRLLSAAGLLGRVLCDGLILGQVLCDGLMDRKVAAYPLMLSLFAILYNSSDLLA